MGKKDVTNKIEFDNLTDGYLPITKCLCGQEFDDWNFLISIYSDFPYECPNCGVKLYYENKIKIFQVKYLPIDLKLLTIGDVNERCKISNG